MKVIKCKEYNGVLIKLINDNGNICISDGKSDTDVEIDLQTIESESWIADAILDIHIESLKNKEIGLEFKELAGMLD